MTLADIINDVMAGGRPDYEQLRLSVILMDRIQAVETDRLARLAEASEPLSDWVNAAFKRMGDAAATIPSQEIPWKDDPLNPEFQHRRRMVAAIIQGRLH